MSLSGVIVRAALAVCLLAATACGGNTPAGSADSRPNLLVIVADDLGYADLGAYGGDIRTPNIDALAAGGVLFTEFHTAPMCAPTRAMLLTGNNNHVAGMGEQDPGADLRQIAGLEGHLSSRVAPLPRVLGEAGYHTYTVGKWHLGLEPEHSPKAAGFERSFNLLQGGGNHFNSAGFLEGGSTYRQDGELVDWPDGRYSTDLYTDRLIEFIDAGAGDARPFFAYAAYTSPHWPLQVPDDELDRYKGRYDAGYDALREARFASLKRAGIIPESSVLPPRNDAIRKWEELTADERRDESRKMELYAAMVENLDHHIGRLIAHLKAKNLYDNTLIVFMGDNGAAGEDFYNRGGFVEYIRARYDNRYENMGRAGSFVSYGPQWAEAGSAPFSRYKGYTREGGIVAPMIASGPGVARSGERSAAYVTVMDIAPTLIERAGARYPADGSVRPMLGASLSVLLSGRTDVVHDENHVTVFYHRGRAFVRQGRWKLSNLDDPFDESTLELFDVVADPGETKNLASEQPERLGAMIGLWRERRRELGILLPDEITRR